jgi:hypothetical protein
VDCGGESILCVNAWGVKCVPLVVRGEAGECREAWEGGRVPLPSRLIPSSFVRMDKAAPPRVWQGDLFGGAGCKLGKLHHLRGVAAAAGLQFFE